MESCEVKKCGRKFHRHFKRKGKGLCYRHYIQMFKHGKILERTSRDLNEIISYKKHAEVILYNKDQKEIARAMIDLEDIEKVKDQKWCLMTGYAGRSIRENGKARSLKMHMVILGEKEGLEIDHKDRDRLNNRKSNLRRATRSQNAMNSPSTGYHYYEHVKKWQAKIVVRGESIHLGYHDTEGQAKEARRLGEEKYFGEFAFKH